MVRCRDGSLYVGIATEPAERVKEHNWGVGAVFTAKRRPVTLVWFQKYATQDVAHRREVEIKGWSRKKKLELIRGFERRAN
jgi:putative endonuclease